VADLKRWAKKETIPMKYLILLSLAALVGCQPSLNWQSKTTLAINAPSSATLSKEEAGRVRQFLVSAKFREMAFATDPTLKSTLAEMRFSDRHVEILMSSPSRNASLSAGRAYAEAAIVAEKNDPELAAQAEVKLLTGPSIVATFR
jgi:hypothetical protein